MYLDTIKYKGLPPRGSLQDRIACEMVLRTRKQKISEHAYLGRILAAGMQLPEAQYQFLTQLLSMEINHDNYSPSTSALKTQILGMITEEKTGEARQRNSMVSALERLEVKEEDLRPLTPAEVESYKRQLRKAKLKRAERVPTET